MSHLIGDPTISFLPNITKADIEKHDEKLKLKNNNKDSKKVRRAFSMQNPFFFRNFSRRSNKVTINPSANGNNENNLCNLTIPIYNNKSDTNTTTTTTINSSTKLNDESCNVEAPNKKRLFRTSWRKFISRIAQQMTSVNITAKHADTDRVPPLGGYVWPPDQTPGVMGLRNHGNTCFMNAVLQCLSHTDILAEYFVLDFYKADLKKRNKINSRKFGTKGELTEQLALVLKALWTCKYDPEHSTSFKAVVDRYGAQFRSSAMHDAQEFLFWLLDKVHEDLNTANKKKYKCVKNSYGRPDEVIAAETLANHIRCNNSFVQAVFQAQFRSSLSCPRCQKQSNTFDPFHCISVQLPQLGHQSVFVTVLYATQHPKQVKLGLGVPLGSPIVALKEQLQADTGIKLDRMVLAEINETGFSRVFCDSHPMSSVIETDPVYCIETPQPSEDIRHIILCITNAKRVTMSEEAERFGTPFCVQVSRDVSHTELQKFLLKEMASILRPEIFAYTTPLNEMFKIRLQDPSADPDTYLDKSVEHPLFTEMIDLALSILPVDVGPPHVKLILEWVEPDKFFSDQSDHFVEHESVSQLKEKYSDISSLTLEQCLEHYTKAETLSAEDAWRCPHCQKYLPVVKTLGLWSLPDILVIHFKRFRQQQLKGTQAAKLTTMVKFPIHGFDMTPHLARSPADINLPLSESELLETEDNWSPWKRTKSKDSSLPRYSKDNCYDLYAVCYHQGDTLETGHYTAACKNPYDHQWYKFDDQKITLIPDDTMLDDIINDEAYILFYQRRKVDNMECSGTSSTSMDHWVSKIGVNSVPASSASSMHGGDAINTKTEDKMKDFILEVPIIVEDEAIGDDYKTPEVKLPSTKLTQDEPKNIPITINENPKLQEEPKLPPQQHIIEAVIENHEEIPMFEIDDINSTTEDELDIETVEIKSNENKVKFPNHKMTDLSEEDLKFRQNLQDEKDFVAQLKNLTENSFKFSEIANNSRAVKSFEYNNYPNRKTICSSSSFRNSAAGSGSDCGTDTIKMIRGSVGSTCSKDTLMYIDHQANSLMESDEHLLRGGRSLWISPVTPHKLITVSPKL